MKHIVLACIALGLLAACSTPSKPSGQVKVGQPYVVLGKKYYPEYDANYDRVGVASWYGPGFHGKYTANGESFDQDDLTAAHPTLPMPSLVRVTNLHNGKSAIIRVNDRGPFKEDRIIDLSRKSAQRLGINGLAKVRVQFLQQETEEYLAAIRSGQDFDMVAYNDRPPQAKIVESTRYSSYSNDGEIQAAPVTTVQTQDNMPIVASNNPPPPEPPVEETYADNKPVESAPPLVAAQPLVAERPPAADVGQEAPAAGGNFTIQAGVFSSEDNARKLADKLSSVARASLETMESADRTLWRVQVGSFASRQEAESLLASVREQGNVPDARIVSR